MFYFDADCGFCVWSLRHLQALTTYLPTSPGKGLYIQRNAYFVDNADRVYFGHKAIAKALKDYGASPLIRGIGYLLAFPIFTPIFAPVYRIIAFNRHRLGPLVGVTTCSTKAP